MQDRVRQSINERNIFLNKYFKLILIFVVILILAFSYFLVIRPKYKAAELLIKDNLVSQQLLLNQQKKKLDTLKIIFDIYSKISPDDLEKFDYVLPYKYKEEQLFGEFEEIANKNGWVLRSVSLDYPDELAPGQVAQVPTEEDLFFGSLNPNLGRINISLSFSGVDYQGVKRVLSVLEESLRLFDISNLSFTGDSSLELSLTTYYYRGSN